MPATERPSAAPYPVALLIAVGLVLFRAVLALLDQTELSTDEAQYWFWGQHLDFGAYSKPPLIGWIIRVSTELFGNTVWAVRLPAVLFHAATAAVIYAAARRIAPHPVPALAALCYLTAPAVALGSALMTTDTPLLLAAAVALLAQMQAGEAHVAGRRAIGAAVLLGVALGCGLLAKHAMLFWLAGSVLAAVLSRSLRPGRVEVLVALAVMLAVVSPHLLWLYRHGFITLLHVQDITHPGGMSLLRPLRFAAEQLVVAGPIVLVALLLSLRRDGRTPGLYALALTPLLIVLAQGLRGPVLANWAVLYLVPGALLAASWLARHRKLAAVSLAIGLCVSLALPLAKAFGDRVTLANGRPLLSRYLGHSDVAVWAIETARAAGAQALLARDRDLLADLSWFASGTSLAIRAIPPAGRPSNHWEMSFAFDPAVDGKPLVLLREASGRPCADATEIARHVAAPGFAGGETLVLFELPDAACLRSSAPEQEPA